MRNWFLLQRRRALYAELLGTGIYRFWRRRKPLLIMAQIIALDAARHYGPQKRNPHIFGGEVAVSDVMMKYVEPVKGEISNPAEQFVQANGGTDVDFGPISTDSSVIYGSAVFDGERRAFKIEAQDGR